MIFVTGGTGLVGSHLLLELTRNGDKVRALRRKSSNLEQVKKVFSWYSNESETLFNKIEWVEGEMLDIYSLENALKGIDLIYNCAAVVSFDSRKRRELISTNVNGTANLVNAALNCGVKRICHVSSVSALGKTRDNLPVTEETKWTPSKKNSGYSESKFFSEAEIWRGVEEGLEAVVVNPSVIIGPGGWDSGSTGFFPVIYKGLRFYTKGKTGFVDVRDVVDTMIMLTRDENFVMARNRKFIISAENIRYNELFTKIADALHKPRPSIYASGIILAVAWRAAAVWSLITGKNARITRETVASSNRETQFDGSAVTQISGFTYRPVDDAIAHTAACFLKDNDSLSR